MRSLRPLTFAFTLFVAPLAAGATLLVPAQYPTIQAAIDAANSNDVVSVAPGLYVETIDMKAGVILKGAGWKTTVIDAGGSGDVVTVEGPAIATFSINGFTLRNSKQTSGSVGNNGVFVNGTGGPSASFGSIRNCRIEHCGTGVRIVSVWSGNITITRNQIVDMIYGGVSAYYGGTSVRHNTIAFCGGTGYRDNAAGGGPFLVENNVIAFNGGYGVQSNKDTQITVQYNDVHGNGLGAYYQTHGAMSSWDPSPATNFQSPPDFAGGYPFDVHLNAGSPCIDAGNPSSLKDPDGTTADVGALWHDPTHVPPVADEFGSGCGGLELTATGTPWAGSIDRFELGFEGAPPFTTVFLLAGLSGATWGGTSLPYDFGAAAPGCQLLAVPTLVVGLPSGPTGSLTLPLALPDEATSVGVPIDVQWAAAAPGANPLGLLFSGGLHFAIGE